MEFPQDASCMCLLLALEVGEKLTVSPDGRLAVSIPTEPEPVAIPSLPDALTALEVRGWARVGADGETVEVTEQGRYAVRRWLTRRTGRAGRLVRGLHWVRVGVKGERKAVGS